MAASMSYVVQKQQKVMKQNVSVVHKIILKQIPLTNIYIYILYYIILSYIIKHQMANTTNKYSTKNCKCWTLNVEHWTQ